MLAFINPAKSDGKRAPRQVRVRVAAAVRRNDPRRLDPWSSREDWDRGGPRFPDHPAANGCRTPTVIGIALGMVMARSSRPESGRRLRLSPRSHQPTGAPALRHRPRHRSRSSVRRAGQRSTNPTGSAATPGGWPRPAEDEAVTGIAIKSPMSPGSPTSLTSRANKNKAGPA